MVETGSSQGNYLSEPVGGVVREISMSDGTVKRFRAFDANDHPAMESRVMESGRTFHAPPKRS